jgi:hypothetical protein
MEQTAVEWLIETHFGSIENCTPDFRNKIQQAKEMEKSQIIDARVKKPLDSEYKEAEQYYNETFNK